VEARNAHVRQVAVAKLTDQALLAKVAVEDKDPDVRIAAVAKLTDQALLAKLAVKDRAPDVRKAAVAKLTDQALLAKLAVEDRDTNIRRAAVAKLTDQALLARLAVEDKDLDVRKAAVAKLTNQGLLTRLATADPAAAIRETAVRKITDESMLLGRIRQDRSAAVRQAAVATLRDQESLVEVATGSFHGQDRSAAKARLRDGAARARVAESEKNLGTQGASLDSTSDVELLLKTALEGGIDVLRYRAARRLGDPGTLGEVAVKSRDMTTLMIVLEKIDDDTLLRRISTNAAEPAMRIAAAVKGKKTTWIAVFTAATRKGRPPAELGDALAAVSLFQDTQDSAIEGVQEASLNLIRRGDESRIPEMVELLERYGDETLAEDYLNCGQPDLDSAGRDWAIARGYDVTTGDGSHRARWGSGR